VAYVHQEWKELSQVIHPDRRDPHMKEQATAEQKLINMAKEILSNKTKREGYKLRWKTQLAAAKAKRVRLELEAKQQQEGPNAVKCFCGVPAEVLVVRTGNIYYCAKGACDFPSGVPKA